MRYLQHISRGLSELLNGGGDKRSSEESSSKTEHSSMSMAQLVRFEELDQWLDRPNEVENVDGLCTEECAWLGPASQQVQISILRRHFAANDLWT